MIVFLMIKLLIVAIFLVMFLRKSKLVWGIGLLAVTSAVLLDTFLGVFNREEMLAELGFFFYVIAGGLFGATAVWLWGVLRPITSSVTATASPTPSPTFTPAASPNGTQDNNAAFDRQLIYDDVRTRFGREDILDLIFDLGIPENDVMTLHQDMNQVIINVMDWSTQQGRVGALALAVERILTPLPPENLPRLEKITADSPPTILRQYLLAHYKMAELEQMTTSLGIDWEQLESRNKKAKVRSLLLHLMRRNRLAELVDLMHKPAVVVS
jgi:hypothetical protein